MFSADHSTTTLVHIPQKSPKTLWGAGVRDFCRLDVLPVTQPTVSKH